MSVEEERVADVFDDGIWERPSILVFRASAESTSRRLVHST